MNAYISRNEAKTCEDMAAATVINFYKNHQIFGDFVASELRTLRSNESRKKTETDDPEGDPSGRRGGGREYNHWIAGGPLLRTLSPLRLKHV